MPIVTRRGTAENVRFEPIASDAKFSLRAFAARKPAALPQYRCCIAEGNAAIQAVRRISKTINSHIAGQSRLLQLQLMQKPFASAT